MVRHCENCILLQLIVLKCFLISGHLHETLSLRSPHENGKRALQGESTRSSTVLTPNHGLSFRVKGKNDTRETVYWRCKKKPKNKHCSAMAISKKFGQEDKETSVGCGKHSHPPITGLLLDVLVRSQQGVRTNSLVTGKHDSCHNGTLFSLNSLGNAKSCPFCHRADNSSHCIRSYNQV